MVHRRTRADTRTPRRAAPGVSLAALVLLCSSNALALDPSLEVSQYGHTAWRIRDGFTQSTIVAIAQTPDGYLWLGTELGLLRFDGVRVVPWQPAWGELPSSYIAGLAVASDGTLWIGTMKGLASFRDGKLANHPEVTGRRVGRMRGGRDGTLWFGATDVDAGDKPAKLCAIAAAKVQCEEHQELGPSILAAYPDHLGNLWVSAGTGLWRWKPGPPEHYSAPARVVGLIEDDDGALLLATSDGVKRLADGKIQSRSLPGLDPVSVSSLLRSSDGNVWIGTGKGLARVHHGRTDVFGAGDGLSHDFVIEMFEDREGNLWVATLGGLDRFRDVRFPTLSTKQGLAGGAWAVQATTDGSVWISAADGLHRWRDGNVTFHRKPSASPASASATTAPAAAAPELEGVPTCLAVDDGGRLWAAVTGGVYYLDGDRFAQAPGLPGKNVWSLAADHHGSAWVSVHLQGLFHAPGGAVEEFPWTRFETSGTPRGALALLQDPWDDGVWLGFSDGGVTHFKDGRVIATYTAADGLGAGHITHLRSGAPGTVWAATESGLSRIKDGHVLTLTARNGLPCDTVHWSIEDDDGSVWLYMPCGLVRVARSELEAWAMSPERTVRASVFDASDGVRTVGLMGYGPRVTKSADGKIWFTPFDGVTVIDPRHLPHNALLPPVHIEQITADEKVYDAGAGRLRLPEHVRDLTIEYTALSLVAPEKVRFRIKLEGQDDDFQELVNERRVRYTNLPPKDYRFIVKASNDSGVWNEEGAVLAFTIPPAFYQTTWFRALGVAAAAALLWVVYRVRVGALHRHELARTNAELRRAKELAEDANRTKDRFLANVSHEIRTPMNAILGMTELVLESQLSEDQRHSFSTVKSASENLLVIIDDLLDFSKIEAGKVELVLSSFSLRTLVRDALRTVAIRAHGKGLELLADVHPEVVDEVVGDPVRLRQILLNLVGNALKFTERGEVEVTVEPDEPGRVRFSVRDTGVGIPAHQHKLIFAAFEQADPASRGRGGTGLGLTIAARLVDLMGGCIDVVSAEGAGSTFRFSARLESGPRAAARVSPPAQTGLRVLVADDSAPSRELIGRWLTDCGMTVTAVADGTAALAALREAAAGRPYAALVLDAQMPGLDGVAVTERLRADPSIAATPIVLLGSSERPAVLDRFRGLGGEAHLAKPLTPEDLRETVRMVVERRAAGPRPAAAAASAIPAPQPLRVLVAEDNELNQVLMGQLLGKCGHDVTVVGDGRAVLALVETARFDVLLLDIHLPEMDGFAVIERIRSRERDGQHLHVIATTARSRHEDREACLAAGMDDFLGKPFVAAALWSALDRVSGGSAER